MKIIKVNSWRDLQDIGDKMPRWGFRGQADHTWGLSTTLSRAQARYRLEKSYL